MGTNFYKMDGTHIGKRSAAGMYCFDCNVTLCARGPNAVHEGRSNWHDQCPECGKKYIPDKLEESSAGLELGFNKNPINANEGVKSCSSFTWAISKQDFYRSWVRKVKDEYGRVYTKKEFIKMLDSYPLHYFHLLGRSFS